MTWYCVAFRLLDFVSDSAELDIALEQAVDQTVRAAERSDVAGCILARQRLITWLQAHKVDPLTYLCAMRNYRGLLAETKALDAFDPKDGVCFPPTFRLVPIIPRERDTFVYKGKRYMVVNVELFTREDMPLANPAVEIVAMVDAVKVGGPDVP